MTDNWEWQAIENARQQGMKGNQEWQKMRSDKTIRNERIWQMTDNEE